VLLRSVLAIVVATGTGVLGAAGAAADPDTAPTVPDVAEYLPVNPADYSVNGGKWLGFAGPAGVVCILDVLRGDYGCSGPLPGAPEGVNLVSGGPSGMPAFSTTDTPPYADAGAVRRLPPNTRLTFRQLFCGVDGTGVVACVNTAEQTGFLVGPEATSIIAPPPPPPPAPEAPEAPEAEPEVPAPVAPVVPGPPPAP
jgi:hypothetical protein